MQSVRVPDALLPVVAHDVPLAPLTTLGVGGPARFLATPPDAAGVAAVVAWARAHALPLLPLGGGSNLVVADEGFAGVALRLPAVPDVAACLDAATRGVAATVSGAAGRTAGSDATDRADGADEVVVDLPGGADWDAVCRAAVAQDLAGLECLVGIPGTLGAAPLQNVGAYGQELADVLVSLDVLDVARGATVRLAAAACGFGYRTSHFKGAWRHRYVVLAVQLRLVRAATAVRPPAYPALAAALRGTGTPPRLGEVAAAVLRLRREKSMVWDLADPNARSAGSFFVNPHVDGATLARLQARFGRVPHFADGPAAAPHKVPAAWLIEHAARLGRGHAFAEAGGRVRLSAHHALALVNAGRATAADVVAAARAVQRRVHDASGITLAAEPQFVGFADDPPLADPHA